MESLIEEQGTLSGKGDLSKIFKSVDEAVAELQNTRRVISTCKLVLVALVRKLLIIKRIPMHPARWLGFKIGSSNQSKA